MKSHARYSAGRDERLPPPLAIVSSWHVPTNRNCTKIRGIAYEGNQSEQALAGEASLPLRQYGDAAKLAEVVIEGESFGDA